MTARIRGSDVYVVEDLEGILTALAGAARRYAGEYGAGYADALRDVAAGGVVPVALGVGGDLALVATLGSKQGLRLLASELVGEPNDAAVEAIAGAQDAAHVVGDAARNFAVVVGALEGDEALQNVVVVTHGHASVDGADADAEQVEEAEDGEEAAGDKPEAHAVGAEVVVDRPGEAGEGQDTDDDDAQGCPAVGGLQGDDFVLDVVLVVRHWFPQFMARAWSSQDNRSGDLVP